MKPQLQSDHAETSRVQITTQNVAPLEARELPWEEGLGGLVNFWHFPILTTHTALVAQGQSSEEGTAASA